MCPSRVPGNMPASRSDRMCLSRSAGVPACLPACLPAHSVCLFHFICLRVLDFPWQLTYPHVSISLLHRLHFRFHPRPSSPHQRTHASTQALTDFHAFSRVHLDQDTAAGFSPTFAARRNTCVYSGDGYGYWSHEPLVFQGSFKAVSVFSLSGVAASGMQAA